MKTMWVSTLKRFPHKVMRLTWVSPNKRMSVRDGVIMRVFLAFFLISK